MIVVKWSFPVKLINQNKGEKSSVVHSTLLYINSEAVIHAKMGIQLTNTGFRVKPGMTIEVNPVRKSSTFQRGGSHEALNPVFALKGIKSSSPLQAAGLSNGVKGLLRQYSRI